MYHLLNNIINKQLTYYVNTLTLKYMEVWINGNIGLTNYISFE